MKPKTFFILAVIAVFAGPAAAWAEDVPPPNAPLPAEQSLTDTVIGVLQGSIDALQLAKDLGSFLVVVQSEATKIAADELRCSVDEQNCNLEKTKRCIAHSKSFANIEAQFKVMQTRVDGARLPSQLREPVDGLMAQIDTTIRDAKEKLTKSICETA